jgi:iron-sulfur cluster assembly accessory protein
MMHCIIPAPARRVFERDLAKVVLDDTSLSHMRGASVDYVQEMMRSSFAVVNNPAAMAKCGCGSSFAPKV